MADFGAQLREARERKGISLRQIAASTKISIAALEGLERNDVSRLPGGIFSRAFVRSYAIEVGLDPDETVRQFVELFSEAASGRKPAQRAEGRGRSATDAHAGSWPKEPSAARQSADTGSATQEDDFESRRRMAGVVLTLVVVSLPVAAAILYFGSRASQLAPRTSQVGRSEASHPGPVHRPASPSPHSAPDAVPVSTVATAPMRSATDGQTPRARERDSVQSALRIEITPTSPCWVKLTVDGEVAVSRVVEAGERETRDFRESAVLQVGDAAACAFTINGRAARPLGRSRQVREIRVTPGNYQSLLR